MKRGFRALAVLAAVAAMSAGPGAFAGCLDFGGFAVFQCADRAYFNPPSVAGTAVNSTFWQVGFGNATLNNGSGTAGTGIGLPSWLMQTKTNSALATGASSRSRRAVWRIAKLVRP